MRARTLLICHDGAVLDQEGLVRWLASFSDLVGIVVLRENSQRSRKRIRKEIERAGALRFLDVLAFRFYYTLFLARRDQAWTQGAIEHLRATYPVHPTNTPLLVTDSPNSAEAEAFVRRCAPDLAIARCKTLLAERVFNIPAHGTFVMHPGVCPEYRNAHGCFWALAQGDYDKVGMTLLRVERGVDTGPVYGYFTYPYDAGRESHIVIQCRVVLENLDAIRQKLLDIFRGSATTLDTNGRPSAVWGQPWLSSYIRLRRRARART